MHRDSELKRQQQILEYNHSSWSQNNHVIGIPDYNAYQMKEDSIRVLCVESVYLCMIK